MGDDLFGGNDAIAGRAVPIGRQDHIVAAVERAAAGGVDAVFRLHAHDHEPLDAETFQHGGERRFAKCVASGLVDDRFTGERGDGGVNFEAGAAGPHRFESRVNVTDEDHRRSTRAGPFQQ